MSLATHFLASLWSTLEAMAPYLLFGFAIAGLLSVFLSPAFVERHLGQRRLGAVLKASLLGVPLPLCSCSVIPVTASLRRHGAGRGATMAFLLSTPQTGIDSILVTVSLLGWVFALFRAVAAFVSGIIGGILANMIPEKIADAPAVPACTSSCCDKESAHAPAWRRAIRYGFVDLPKDIGVSLLLGLLVAGGIAAVVPDDFFAGAIGTGIGAMFVMMALGIPVYVCATASVPIAAALIAKGVSPGAALVFLIAGPATNAATISTLWKMLGRAATFVYVGTVAVTSIVSGLALDAIYAGTGAQITAACHDELPAIVRWTCVAALLGVLLWPSLKRLVAPDRGATAHTH